MSMTYASYGRGRNVTYQFYLITINKLSFNIMFLLRWFRILLYTVTIVQTKHGIKFYCHVLYRSLGRKCKMNGQFLFPFPCFGSL